MRKVLFVYYLSTYPVGGKMKIHRNIAFSFGKNGFEEWINVLNYEKSAFHILLIYISCHRKNENP
jgi:hypothetical protein